ncbi:MAG: hypothetical protein WBM50_05365 [Acidimicrobiales bacterium]
MSAGESDEEVGGSAPEGVLVLSVWSDDEPADDDHDAIRVRVLVHPDLPGVGRFVYAATVEDVLEIVRRWLQLLVGDGGPDVGADDGGDA